VNRQTNLASGVGILVLSLTGCPGEESPPTGAPVAGAPAESAGPDAAALAEWSKRLFGTLPQVAESTANPVTPEKVALGQALYHDPRLSKSQAISCNSCHDVAAFGVDNEPTSPGHKGARGTRNSPTSFNAAVHGIGQFWDVREPDVEAQAKGPVLNPVEMAMPSAEHVEGVLKSIPGYADLFKAAFPAAGEPITYDHMAMAIGAFERKLITPDRFDAFMNGDHAALSAQELQGLQAFREVGCVTCHQGPALGGTMVEKLGKVEPYETKDQGIYEVTQQERDRLLFKVPGLRNVAKTGPYLHDGSIASLDEMVRIMAKHQLGKELDDAQVADLVAFLNALTGELDPELAKVPELPDSGPETPGPDES
jgi:cytochrome c peroxidase